MFRPDDGVTRCRRSRAGAYGLVGVRRPDIQVVPAADLHYPGDEGRAVGVGRPDTKVERLLGKGRGDGPGDRRGSGIDDQVVGTEFLGTPDIGAGARLGSFEVGRALGGAVVGNWGYVRRYGRGGSTTGKKALPDQNQNLPDCHSSISHHSPSWAPRLPSDRVSSFPVQNFEFENVSKHLHAVEYEIDLGTVFIFPVNRHLGNFQAKPAGQKKNFDVERESVQLLTRKNVFDHPRLKHFEAALRVPDALYSKKIDQGCKGPPYQFAMQ